MKINVAKHCGFCSGVKHAIELAESSLAQYGKIAVLGDLVHNKDVMNDLRSKGLVYIRSLGEINGMPLLLRAHGTDKDIIKESADRGIIIIDATCPLVLDIHRHAKELESENRQVIIIGDKDHDEVLGIKSYLINACVINSLEDLENCAIKQRTGVVIQSTQFIKSAQEIISVLLTKSGDCRIINTICQPTRRNQKEIQELASENDAVVVIGDPGSANSKRLAEVARSLNDKVLMISTPEELDMGFLHNCNSVGVSAGASTPDHLIQSVLNKLINS